jgi:membrane-anchored protein YejM (alkaline phosphatase superfamily)
MNKKSFALSWGRKMFFGLGWALTSVVALTYFQSMIIPQSASSWTYVFTTFVGYYGVLLSLVYFFLYCPVVILFPKYYVSRIWSIVLILSLNLVIFFDGYLFSRYRFHANSFLWNFLGEKNALEAFGLSSIKLGLIGFVTTVMFFVLWFRGERLWRSMQARFSNPVKNWYLVFIALCFLSSQGMSIYGAAKGTRAIYRLAELFPLNFPLLGKELLKEQGVTSEISSEKDLGYKDFYYSDSVLNCAARVPKNILIVMLDKWSADELNTSSMPNVAHYGTHGLVFTNHYSGGMNKNDGYFSFLYSLPGTYARSVINQSMAPVFLTQAKKKKMDVSFFQTGGMSPVTKYLPEEKEIFTDYIEANLIQRNELLETNPFMMHVFLEGGTLTDKDAQVKRIMDLFFKHRQIKDTIIILTGAYSDQLKTPFIMIWPGKKPATISKLTSHYDILPSIMLEDWKCKNRASDFSLGKNFFSKEETDQFVAANDRTIKILDTKNETMTTIEPYQCSVKVENGKRDVVSIMNSLNRLTRFYQRQ